MMPSVTGRHITWFNARGLIVQGSRYKVIDPDGHVWYDRGAELNGEGAFASGMPYDTPGIAVPNNYRTLGELILLELPDIGIKIRTYHVDVGPRWNVVDCSSRLAYLLFKTEGNFKDYSAWKLTPLGDPPNPGLVNVVEPL